MKYIFDAERIFRPHPLHTVHRCGLFLPMLHIAWSLRAFVWVCVLAHESAVKKQLNRSTCHFGGRLVWAKGSI